MVTLYKPDPMQVDILSYRMDLAGIAYEVKSSHFHHNFKDDIWLEVNGVPLDYYAAITWVEERMPH